MNRKQIFSLVILTLTAAVQIFATGFANAGDLKGRVKGTSTAVVFLEGVPGTVPKTDTVITHKPGGAFDPPIAIGFVGNDFVFRNEDDTLHTTHLYLELEYQKEVSGRPIKNGATLYNIALPKKGMEVHRAIKPYHQFSKDTGSIAVRCNPHPAEKAAALVFNHPYVAIVDENGDFDIPNVPPGMHDVWIWHDGKASKWKSVEVKDGSATEIVVDLGG